MNTTDFFYNQCYQMSVIKFVFTILRHHIHVQQANLKILIILNMDYGFTDNQGFNCKHQCHGWYAYCCTQMRSNSNVIIRSAIHSLQVQIYILLKGRPVTLMLCALIILTDSNDALSHLKTQGSLASHLFLKSVPTF